MRLGKMGAMALLAACLACASTLTASWAADSEIEEVVYGFEGIYKGDQRLNVTKGTRHAQEAKLVKKTVAFDMTQSQIDVDDTNDDGYNDFRDILAGDRVTIKTELRKKRPGRPPFPARLVVDESHPQPRCQSGSRPGCRP